MAKTIDFNQIQLLIMDVDGVLTDGGIIVHSDGSESKRFCVYDGHRIRMWHRAGRITAIISGRESLPTILRAEQLEIKHVHQGCTQKLPAFESLLNKLNLTPKQVAYVGDDLMDIPIVRRAGFGVAVANAVEDLRQVADWVTHKCGGNGAVGETVEYILKQTDAWDLLMQRYWV
ncbi:MAG: HAD hydrolase family protein [Planctomycetes bacterium]|jgi:3-deoxy-D-manno-octulosonate 8-phosphate phosphatase (KDO 8-P phosphatase)|nr:HAD hydrolase family protein [Planctomycetota bacterium]